MNPPTSAPTMPSTMWPSTPRRSSPLTNIPATYPAIAPTMSQLKSPILSPASPHAHSVGRLPQYGAPEGPQMNDAAGWSWLRPLEDLVGHDQAVDLVRPLVDLGALRVAHQPLDSGLTRVAAATEQLDGIGRDPHRRVRRRPFRERRGLADRVAAIAGRRGVARQRPGRGDVPCHVGEHEAESLLVGERRTERTPLVQIGSR